MLRHRPAFVTRRASRYRRRLPSYARGYEGARALLPPIALARREFGDEQGDLNYRFPESCPAVLARAAGRREWLSRPLGEPPHYADLDGPAARAVIASFLDREPADGWLSLAEAEALLATHGIPVATSHHCRDVERAVAVAAEIGAPAALKADLPPPRMRATSTQCCSG